MAYGFAIRHVCRLSPRFCFDHEHTRWSNNDVIDIEVLERHVVEDLEAIGREAVQLFANRPLSVEPESMNPDFPLKLH